MKFTHKVLASAIALIGLAGQGYAADSLVSFTSGSAAKASEVNANFEYLESRIDALADDPTNYWESVDIDCETTPTALQTYLSETNFAGGLTVNVTGTCDGPIEFGKDDVKLVGGAINGANEDGDDVLLAIWVGGHRNIRIVDTVINSGLVDIRRESYVRFEDVTFPATSISNSDYDEYEANLYVVSSTVRIQSGSLDNLAIEAANNSYVRLQSGLTGSVNSIVLKGNSSLKSKLDTLTVNGYLGVVLSSSFQGNDISVGTWIEASGSSSIYASSISSDNAYLALYEGASMSIEGDFTALAMECHGSSFWIGGSASLTGTHDEADGRSGEFEHSCGGEFSGGFSANGDVYISSGSDVTGTE